MALSEFGKSVTKDDQEKEFMPYELYTAVFVDRGGLATINELINVPNFKDFNQRYIHQSSQMGIRIRVHVRMDNLRGIHDKLPIP